MYNNVFKVMHIIIKFILLNVQSQLVSKYLTL